MPIEWLIIDALISLMLGGIAGVFLGARLTRSHYLYMTKMMQPPRQAPPPQPRPHRPTRQLYQDPDYY